MLIEQIYKPLLMCYQEHRVTKCQIALGFTATILLAPIGIVASLVDTLIGIIQGIGYAFTKKTSWHKSMEKTFAQAALPLAMPVRMLLIARRTTPKEKDFSDNLKSIDDTHGPASELIKGSITTHADNSADKDKTCFERHVISRGLFLLSGVVGVVCRVVDLLLGLLCAFYACRAKKEFFLNLVELGFMITGIFSDLGFGLAKFIYPFDTIS